MYLYGRNPLVILQKKTNENDSGIFDNKGNSTSKVLKDFISFQSLSGQCHLVLAHAHSQIVQVVKPNVPAAEMNAALKW